jgi:hypothetical protein
LVQTVRPTLYFLDLGIVIIEELVKSGFSGVGSIVNSLGLEHLIRLLKTVATIVVAVGLWRAKFWSLFLFDLLIAFQLWGRIANKDYSPLPLLLDIILIFLPWYGFAIIGSSGVGRKVKPKSKNPSEVQDLDKKQKAKNPVDDLIY